MSIIIEKKSSVTKQKFMIEKYESAQDVIHDCDTRSMTSSSFEDARGRHDEHFTGVKNYGEALEYMRAGYQPNVEKLQKHFRQLDLSNITKRVQTVNDIVGFAPVVPLVLQGRPQCMINTKMTKIKAKVIDVYFDMGVAARVDKDDMMKAANKVIASLIELEMQGYRFNLYVCSTYADSSSCDMIVIKVKNSSTPLDLKRMSFLVGHIAFYRAIGFDWYSKTPKGKYRGGYGCNLFHEVDSHGKGDKGKMQTMSKAYRELFGDSVVFFSCSYMCENEKETTVDYLKEVIALSQIPSEKAKKAAGF